MVLRAATAADHEATDARFARFDLADRASYGAFLTAHARALPAVEAALAGVPGLPPFAPRTELLRADLTELGVAAPELLPFDVPGDPGRAYGMLYVSEGSRLGGVMLARSVAAGLPRAYLAAAHGPGGWRAFGEALDAAADAGGAKWLDEAVAGARETFALYQRAAEMA